LIHNYKFYYFELQDTPYGEIPLKEYEMGIFSIGGKDTHVMKINNVRLPGDDEIGLNSPYVVYVRQ